MKKIPIASLILGINLMQAQQAVVATGGNASGSGGRASYSVGQMAYQSYKTPAGEIDEGVQQAYEITTLATFEKTEKNISLYPNPVQDILYLDFNEESYKNAEYQLFDAQGKLIKQGRLSQKKNELNLSTLPQSIYILRIIQEGKNTKTFKIIKK